MKTGAPKGHGYVLLLGQNTAIYAVWDGFTTCDNVVSYVSIGSRLVRGYASITIDSTRCQVIMDPTRMKARHEEIGTVVLVFGNDGLPHSGTVGGSHTIHFGGARKCWTEGDGTRTYESEKVRIAGQYLNYHGTLRFSITPRLETDLSLVTITGAGVKVRSGVFYCGFFVNGLFLKGSVYDPGKCIVIGEFSAPTGKIALPDSWGLFYDIKNDCLQENQYRYGTPVTMRDCITMQSHTAYTPRDVVDLYTSNQGVNMYLRKVAARFMLSNGFHSPYPERRSAAARAETNSSCRPSCPTLRADLWLPATFTAQPPVAGPRRRLSRRLPAAS